MRRPRLTIPAIAALVIAALAGCSSAEKPISEAPLTAGGDSPGDDADDEAADDTGGGEISASVMLDGEELQFTEMHCGPVPVNDNGLRFLGIYDGGEVQIDEEGGSIIIRSEEGSDFNNNVTEPLDVHASGASGEIEVENLEDERVTVSVDISC